MLKRNVFYMTDCMAMRQRAAISLTHIRLVCSGIIHHMLDKLIHTFNNTAVDS